MPICDFCSHMEATANMRRRRPPHTGHWRCKDDVTCKARVKQQRAEQREEMRQEHAAAEAEARMAQFDDDPSPYSGTYSEE